MGYRSGLFGIVVPAMMLASVACAAAVPTASPASTIAASPTATAAGASPALPQADDLTLGQDAGKLLVGLTVRPAHPGPNTLLVYVLPLEARRPRLMCRSAWLSAVRISHSTRVHAPAVPPA